MCLAGAGSALDGGDDDGGVEFVLDAVVDAALTDFIDVKEGDADDVEVGQDRAPMVEAADRLRIPTGNGTRFDDRWSAHGEVRGDLRRAVADDGWSDAPVGHQSPAAR